MSASDFQRKIKDDGVETVILCIPDMQGRLVGKRESAEFFLNHADTGGHMCDYLFTVDIEGNPIPGFQTASWEKGYGDFTVMPDISTWRKLPWRPGSAIVLGNCVTQQGEKVRTSPRAILQAQIEAGRAAGYSFNFASELEFYVYDDTYDGCIEKDFKNMKPSSPYSQDYNLLRTSDVEPMFRELRQALASMGISVEASKGEWGPGQHEISLRYGDPMANADNHVYYKHAVKEIAAKHGKSATFMAKPSSDVAGSSCHIHASVWSADGKASRSADDGAGDGLTKEFRHFMAGIMTYAPEATLFFAPTVNSYKRFQSGSFAPTRICWGRENRTAGFRLVGHGDDTRVEVRIPGADANAHLAFAAMIAAGLKGIREELPLPPATAGNAYTDPSLKEIPKSLAEAATLLDGSRMLRETLGDVVVNHYVHAARWEVSQFEGFVTDWEKRRLFERA